MDHKVYVTLGFHINFYHSWRGDTPDEAGFGTDMRVIRRVIAMLDAANARGLQARGYWDTEVYWTFQEIVPKHAPDILDGIRRRVDAGLDEIVVGPFNNGANHAAPADEFRAAVALALENPWGSGLRQLFGKVAPYYRPQEMMVTAGQEDIFRELGFQGLILYYAGVPFNTLAAFIEPLTVAERHNPLRLRLRPGGAALTVLPCISTADLFEHGSFEALLLDLRRAQRRGEIKTDVLVHLNADADLETWLPVRVPRWLGWFPNLGGLEEYIRVVNKYPWAQFTVPSEYAAAHPPLAERTVRQDLADGAFDGNYSWAEKFASQRTWTLLERSRLASLRVQALAGRLGRDVRAELWDGMGSAFFQRLIGLSTTHFGMSTPVINEERQARADAILGGAAQIAEGVERRLAAEVRAPSADDDLLYDLELYPTPPARDLPFTPALVPLALPLVLPEDVDTLQAEFADGRPLPVSLTDPRPLPGGRTAVTLRGLLPEGSLPARVRILSGARPVGPGPGVEPGLRLDLCPDGAARLFREDDPGGGLDLPGPFVTYRGRSGPRVFRSPGGEVGTLPAGEVLDGQQRVRLVHAIPMRTRQGGFTSHVTWTFTLFAGAPFALVDINADFAYTPPGEVIHNMVQKLRRLIDLAWIEVAPFEICPRLDGSRARPLRVWKHNYLGVTASYDLDYGRINPRNAELEAFNHQVTAGWVAVSDGRRGLLVGENAEALASMAFCPMRLRERDGRQVLSLNPFGSYYGRQLDHSHLGGSGVGARLLEAFSGALAPNGPSYNGQRLRFSLLLAPYRGDEPPADLQALTAAHFYPPGVIVHRAPAGVTAETGTALCDHIAAQEQALLLASDLPVEAPTAALANPSAGAADLVWDPPRNAPVSGYDVAWRAEGADAWRQARIGPADRWRVDGLADGAKVTFRLRALRGERASAWTEEFVCVPGAVTDASLGAMLRRLPLGALLRMIAASLWAAIRAVLGR